MIVRIRFAKFGALRFIGHLDVMRYFQKVVRRADLPVRYSQGFTPHQILTFALPLSLSVSSDGEYMDIEFVNDDLTPEQILEAMRAHTGDGFALLDCGRIPDPVPGKKSESLMSIVSGAEYMISWKDGFPIPFANQSEVTDALKRLYERESIVVTKNTKKSSLETDIKPFIYRLYAEGDGFDGLSLGNDEYTRRFGNCDNKAHSGTFENGRRMFVCLSAGSVVNIKPELVLEALYEMNGLEYDRRMFFIHRMELYRGEKELVPLI